VGRAALAVRAGSGACVCCGCGLVAVSAAAGLACFVLRPCAELEGAVVRASCSAGPDWTLSLAAGFDDALSGQTHLSHSGQSCAEASAAIIAAMAVNPASNRRTLVIASSSPCRVNERASKYDGDGTFWRRQRGFPAAFRKINANSTLLPGSPSACCQYRRFYAGDVEVVSNRIPEMKH
jgi:hypothetical protein